MRRARFHLERETRVRLWCGAGLLVLLYVLTFAVSAMAGDRGWDLLLGAAVGWLAIAGFCAFGAAVVALFVKMIEP